MDRLTYRLEDQWENPTDSIILRPYMRYQDEDVKKIILNRLAYYEDLEEQGKLLVLPCKLGSTIYQTNYKCTCTVGHRYLHNTCTRPSPCLDCPAVEVERWIREMTFSLGMLDRIGEDFFVTREEAEEALKNI